MYARDTAEKDQRIKEKELEIEGYVKENKQKEV